jgi:hypothetical protein
MNALRKALLHIGGCYEKLGLVTITDNAGDSPQFISLSGTGNECIVLLVPYRIGLGLCTMRPFLPDQHVFPKQPPEHLHNGAVHKVRGKLDHLLFGRRLCYRPGEAECRDGYHVRPKPHRRSEW